MKTKSSRLRMLKVLLGLGALNLGICFIFPNCGIIEFVEPPVGDSRIMNQLSKGPMGGDNPKNVFITSKPIPESRWNGLGLWKEIRSNPPTYVPKGYATTPPAGNSRGTWFVDARDGKRLFAPNTSYKGYSAAIWKTEAAKITATR